MNSLLKAKDEIVNFASLQLYHDQPYLNLCAL